jgi:alkylhydroperoxidase family enzyme
MRLKKPRVMPLAEADYTDEARALFEKGLRDGAGRPLNIFATLAHHPGLLRRWLVFGAHVLGKSTLPPRERELAILRVGWLCRSEYEFGQHTRIGRAVGLTDAEIRRATEGSGASGWSDRDRCLLKATDELVRDHFVTDATWTTLEQTLELRQILDLLFTVGQYVMVSMVLNTLGVQLEAGAEGFPE